MPQPGFQCGADNQGLNGFPPPTDKGDPCAALYRCCPTITVTGGADACYVAALEDYGGQLIQFPDACTPAIQYFQELGFCQDIDAGKTDAGT